LYAQALRADPKLARGHTMLGYVKRELGESPQAAQHLQRAIELDDSIADAHFMLADIAMAEGGVDAAIAGYVRTLELAPDQAHAYKGLCQAYFRKSQFEQALGVADRGIVQSPDFADLHFFRGNVLSYLNQYEAAIESFERALALQGASAELYFNRGVALQALNRVEEAIASYRQAQELAPSMTEAHFSESICRLLLGDLAGGWEKFEYRWHSQTLRHAALKFRQPRWTGEQSLIGKTLLIAAEQGYGDTIQFARYATLAAARGARVLLLVHDVLAPLMARIEGVSKVLTNSDELPDFDYYCPTLSLPLAFKTTLQSIPAPPAYLHGNPERESFWRSTLTSRRRAKRIGIAWSGNPAHVNDQSRSIALSRLLPLLHCDADFFVLQRDVSVDDVALLETRDNVVHYGSELHGFDATAALMAQMDLVISVDTSIAHLAGALGRPVWLLLSINPDWRWMLGRDDSPWYPSMRLFRQQFRDDWERAIARVTEELRATC